jgi:hypothetical protein
MQNQRTHHECVATLCAANLLIHFATQALNIPRTKPPVPVRPRQYPQCAVCFVHVIEMNPYCDHTGKNLNWRLDVEESIVAAPRNQSFRRDLLNQDDRPILMPRDGSIGPQAICRSKWPGQGVICPGRSDRPNPLTYHFPPILRQAGERAFQAVPLRKPLPAHLRALHRHSETTLQGQL